MTQQPPTVPSPVVIALPTADRRTSYAFYSAGLGLETVGELADDGVPEPLQVVLNAGVRLMLIPTGGFGWIISGRAAADCGTSECVLTLTVAAEPEVDALLERARRAGAAVVGEPQQQPWAYTASFTDPDGHLWMVTTPEAARAPEVEHNARVSIDLNADLGESYGRWTLGDDEAMLDLVTSANIACGFHAGDPATLHRSCRGAVARGVVIGAQVGYPDLVGFGRRFIDISSDDLIAAVLYQIGALDGLARSVGGRVRYVKPHGALYNTAVHHEQQAAAVVEAVRAYDPGLPILGLPGSVLLQTAEDQGLRAVREYFIDRNYTPDGRLVDRRQPDALIHDPDEAARRAVDAAGAGVAESMCTHGDSPGAVQMAQTVRRALGDAGITVVAFCSD